MQKKKTSEEASNVPIYALHYTLTATKEGKNRFSPYKVICTACRVLNRRYLTIIIHFCCLYDAIPFSFQVQVVYTEKIPRGTQKVDQSSSNGWLMLFMEKKTK